MKRHSRASKRGGGHGQPNSAFSFLTSWWTSDFNCASLNSRSGVPLAKNPGVLSTFNTFMLATSRRSSCSTAGLFGRGPGPIHVRLSGRLVGGSAAFLLAVPQDWPLLASGLVVVPWLWRHPADTGSTGPGISRV